MNYQQFIKQLEDEKIDINGYHPFDAEKLYTYDEKKTRHSRKRERKFDFIIQYWVTGGVDGGSCWETSNPEEFYTGDKDRPKGFKELDKILQFSAPDLSYSEFKRIENNLIKQGTDTHYEYYGNREDYSYEYENLKDLYDFLFNNEHLQY